MRSKVILATGVAFALLASADSSYAAHVARLTNEHAAPQAGRRIEVKIELDRDYDNPFDPAEIAVDALVVTPSGSVVRVPAFWDRDTERSTAGGRELITAVGAGYFRLRYAALEAGKYEVSIVAKDAASEDVSAAMPFDVVLGEDRGFVRVDPTDPMGLAYDDGTQYLAVGANVCWSTEAAAGYDMQAYLQSIADSGGNWSRLWMTHFGEGWTIEWSKAHPSGYYAGLGRYSVEVARRLDDAFAFAEREGIAIQLVLWQHSQFETENWSSWPENPYNAANGGPASNSEAFFTNNVAVRLSAQRLRYLVARYASFRSLFAWEIMNEMDGVNAPSDAVFSWAEARARELRAMDPAHHLVTTSHLVRPYLSPLRAYSSDAYDLTQAHAYGASFGFAIPKDAQALAALGKPMIFGEFGLDYLGELEQQDPRGVHLAEGSWIAMSSGYAGGAMSWWWDTYLRPNDLWASQRGLAAVAKAVDLRGMHAAMGDDVRAEAADGTPLEVFGRRGEPGAFLYVRHKDARWEVAKDHPMPSVLQGRVRVPCDAGTRCVARMFSTAGGELTAQDTLAGEADGAGWLTLPAFDGSIAVEVRPGASRMPSPSIAAGGCAVSPWIQHSPWHEAVALMTGAWLLRRRRRSVLRSLAR